MTGATKETIERRKKYTGHLNQVSILIEGKPTPIDPHVGRKKYYNSLIASKYNRFKSPRKIYDLTYHENITKNNNTSVLRDVYIDNFEQPQTLIICVSVNVLKQRIPYPSCEQSFEYKKLRFSVNYSVDYLPYWEEIQEKVKNLIEKFEYKSIQSQSSNTGE